MHTAFGSQATSNGGLVPRMLREYGRSQEPMGQRIARAIRIRLALASTP